MELQIHHIGYLVKNLKRAQVAFEELGYNVCSETIRDEYRKIDILFLEKDGYCVELVCPFDKTTKIADMARRVGNSPYHICYLCEDIIASASEFEKKGYVLCDDLHEAVAFDDRKVCFYIHPFLGMVELLEKE